MPGPMKNPDPAIYTQETGREYIGDMSARQMQDAIARREISFLRIGRNIRLRKSDLDQYIERRSVSAL